MVWKLFSVNAFWALQPERDSTETHNLCAPTVARERDVHQGDMTAWWKILGISANFYVVGLVVRGRSRFSYCRDARRMHRYMADRRLQRIRQLPKLLQKLLMAALGKDLDPT